MRVILEASEEKRQDDSGDCGSLQQQLPLPKPPSRQDDLSKQQV